MFCDMIDQIIEYNIMSPLLRDGYRSTLCGAYSSEASLKKAWGVETIKTHPWVPKDIVVVLKK